MLALVNPLPCGSPDRTWVGFFGSSTDWKHAAEVRQHLRFMTNPAAQLRAGRVLLREKFAREDGQKNLPEVSVRATRPVRLALDYAKQPIPFVELKAKLIDATGAAEGKVHKLLTDLWEQTVLLSDLTPAFTSLNPAGDLSGRIQGIEDAKEEYEMLSALLEDLASWDRADATAAVKAYPALDNRMRSVIEVPTDPPIQTDMHASITGNRINRSVGEEVARAAELLLRLTPFPGGPPGIASYRRAFQARYNEGREVPLLELLDPLSGLGPVGSVASYNIPPPKRAREIADSDATRLSSDSLRRARPGVGRRTDIGLANVDAPSHDGSPNSRCLCTGCCSVAAGNRCGGFSCGGRT